MAPTGNPPGSPTAFPSRQTAQSPPGNHKATEAPGKISIFGARAVAKEAIEELARLRAQMQELGALDIVQLQQRRDDLRHANGVAAAAGIQQAQDLQRDAEKARSDLEGQLAVLGDRLKQLKQQVVVTQESAILQEVGIYQYRHPLADSTEYKDALARLQQDIKALAKRDGGAVLSAQGWTVNGSDAQGRTMLRNYCKLMLRAYNAEADNLVRGLKPYKLVTAQERLEKVTSTIQRLGKTMDIRIAPNYHRLRLRELELTADYQEKLAREKDREREERERLREERKAQAEIERERERLKKEQQHYQNAMDALIAKGDVEAMERIRLQLMDIDKAIADVDYRAANVRAGYVYVISNLGSFGEHMIKIGMTRRLEPMDRIRELSDASVPFNFDIHALFFADDAVGIESQMHHHFADQRVNRVNLRREFFYATPTEAREHLLALTGDLLRFEESPEAIEYHQSQTKAASPVRASAAQRNPDLNSPPRQPRDL